MLLAGAGVHPLVWTDATLWDDNPAWRASPDGHLLAPLNAGRDDAGCGVLIAACSDRLSVVLDKRLELSAGEAVTVVVSMLRGVLEADGLSVDAGTWWVTSDGKPVCAVGGASALRDDAAAVMARVRRLAPDAMSEVIGSAAEVLAEPRRLRLDIGMTEDRLFDLADPLPLATQISSVRARAVSATPAIASGDEAEAEPAPPPTSQMQDFVRRHVDSEWADRIDSLWQVLAAALSAVRSRVGERAPASAAPGRSRRPAVLAACGVGAAVLAVGLAWPGDGEGGTSMAPAPITGTVSRSPGADRATAVPPSPQSTAPVARGDVKATAPEASDDLAHIGAGLIDRLAACAADRCDASIVEDPNSSFPEGPATAAGAERSVSVLDDYGGVAVLSVRAAQRSQIAVIVRSHEKWLVRDVYDVADQPE